MRQTAAYGLLLLVASGCASVSTRATSPEATLAALESGSPAGSPQAGTVSTTPHLPTDRVSPEAAPRRKGFAGLRTKKAIEADFSQRLGQAKNHELSGKLDDARRNYEQLIVEFPERHQPYHALARVADRQRRFREAQALYGEAIRRAPHHAELFNDLGYCYYLDGQLPKAESALLKAVALSPAQSRYHNNLGLVYGHQGRLEQALEQFRAAGSEADAQYNMAFVFASQNKTAAAMQAFRLALAADPTYERARDALKSFERAEKDPEGMLDEGEMIANGVRWVPFVESSAGHPAADNAETQSLVQQASALLSTRAPGIPHATENVRNPAGGPNWNASSADSGNSLAAAAANAPADRAAAGH